MSASKTIAVPVQRLYSAFVDAEIRERWLTGAALHARASRPGRSTTFDWQDQTRIVVVTFTPCGEARSQVAVQHQRLRDAGVAEEMKAYWRERLAALKALLEG